MPVTIKTANTTPTGWDRLAFNQQSHVNPRSSDATHLLSDSAPDEFRRLKGEGILQSSFDDQALGDAAYISPSKNGFVNTMVKAYSDHHHVRIRPEDVWFSILNQLNFYINKNAEDLRSLFVAHKGRKALKIEMGDRGGGGGIKSIDYADFAKQMTHLLQENVLDPDLRAWIMPDFSTTTDNDLVVASILMMGSLQAYFTYFCVTSCGIPSVTLLGERADWEKLLGRLDGLPRLGKEPTTFATLLRPIIRRFIASFDNPADSELLDFWARSVDVEEGSGADTLSGWITAFCFWDSKGICTYRSGFGLALDDVTYGWIDLDTIPSGSSGVPVTVVYYGAQTPTRMVAGSVGIQATTKDDANSSSPASSSQPSSAQDDPGDGPELRDTIQPVSGWWIFSTE
ncbi:hypothetical protein B0T22DRAFT_373112 [Podospora appendiculata]|uniref:DUF4419 domain-containing protein n=1 Tax=Podospora appendiculata TaxID=314037 RepID=A0AAE0XLR8_9PEZI|nr:hypothetical protein B0T22DRAFT_373112 [Podospora appendiculata]